MTVPVTLVDALRRLFGTASVTMTKHFTSDGTVTTMNSGTPIVGVIIVLFAKLSVNSGMLVTNLIKTNGGRQIGTTVRANFSISLVDKLVVLAINYLVTGPVLNLLSAPTDVVPLTIDCLGLCFLNVPFLVVCSFNGTILETINSAGQPLFYLVFSKVIGIILGLVLMVNFRVDSSKATVTAAVTGTIDTTLVCHLLIGRANVLRFS